MPAFSEERLSDEDLDDIVAWLASRPVAADDYPTWFSTDLINLPTPAAVAPKTLEVHFGHRFGLSIRDAGREGLWGLDSFAFPSFYFAYGIFERVSAYGGRTSNFATWEYGAKIDILTEDESSLPLAIGAVVGGTYLDFDLVENNARFTLEIPVGLRVHDRLSLLAVPFFATGSDHPNDPDSDGNAAALGLGGSFQMTPRLSMDFEWIKHVDGYERPNAMAQWQAMLGIRAGGHVFQVGVTNSVQYTPDFMAGGAPDTELDSEVRLGFNIVRAFTFGDGRGR